MRTKEVLLIICILGSIVAGKCQEYAINTNKTTLQWTGKAAFSSYALSGTLNVRDGNVTIVDNEVTALNIIVDMKTLDHNNKELKKHLKSKDFFEVKKYPYANFSSSNTFRLDQEKTVLIGTLSIKNKVNLENIPVVVERTEAGILVKFTYAIDRTNYGINYNTPGIFAQMKENAIAKEFILKGVLIFN